MIVVSRRKIIDPTDDSLPEVCCCLQQSDTRADAERTAWLDESSSSSVDALCINTFSSIVSSGLKVEVRFWSHE